MEWYSGRCGVETELMHGFELEISHHLYSTSNFIQEREHCATKLDSDKLWSRDWMLSRMAPLQILRHQVPFMQAVTMGITTDGKPWDTTRPLGARSGVFSGESIVLCK